MGSFDFVNSFQDIEGMLADTSLFNNYKGSKGFGKSYLSGIGSAAAKGKGRPPLLAIKDVPKPPPPEKSHEKLVEEALAKARKMRDLAYATATNYEDANTEVKKSKFWSKAAQKDADVKLTELKTAAETLKKFLSTKKTDDINLIKGRIMECGIVVKACIGSIKEFKHLSAKTGSVATSKKATK